jgi:hypothetical protein
MMMFHIVIISSVRIMAFESFVLVDSCTRSLAEPSHVKAQVVASYFWEAGKVRLYRAIRAI